jgi:8-oxo-dGTP pyrophosphatase MutT (NUDIX family)
MNKSRTSLEGRIREVVEHIVPFDSREQADVVDVLDWVDDGSELFRLQSPDVPHKHLVSYLAVVDNARHSMLLMDHVKAGLWVPPGGHVWPGEDPFDAAGRELVEELGMKAAQVSTVANLPLFVTVTQTRGPGTHTDVSLWYVVAGDEHMWLDVDQREFNGHKWVKFEDVLEMDTDTTDPELHRFVRKLQARL